MALIQHILDKNARGVLSIAPTETVFDAINMMAGNNIGSVIVLDDDGKMAGIITERDYARKVILVGRSSRTTTVGEIMTSRVVCARPEHTVEECMAIMTEKAIRHLPVLDAEKVVGMISIGDLVKSIIDDQKFTIEQLEHYIAG